MALAQHRSNFHAITGFMNISIGSHRDSSMLTYVVAIGYECYNQRSLSQEKTALQTGLVPSFSIRHIQQKQDAPASIRSRISVSPTPFVIGVSVKRTMSRYASRSRVMTTNTRYWKKNMAGKSLRGPRTGAIRPLPIKAIEATRISTERLYGFHQRVGDKMIICGFLIKHNEHYELFRMWKRPRRKTDGK